MEAAIQTLVKVFLKSAKGRESLGKKEFQGLVKSQLSNILSVRKSFPDFLSDDNMITSPHDTEARSSLASALSSFSKMPRSHV